MHEDRPGSRAPMNAAPAGLDRRDIEAIYPLTPMQLSLLFAALRSGRGSDDPGFLQVRCTIRGNLDEAAFHTAWDRLIERHAALRTSIHWQNVDRPLQLVVRRAQPSWTIADVRHLAPDAQDRHIDAWLEQDRRGGIDLSRAPLLRLARFRRTDAEWAFVMSCHHVLLDGWSGAILLEEVVLLHDALRHGRDTGLDAARPFGDYVNWLLRQDQSSAERHWRQHLAGVAASVTLPFPAAVRSGAGDPAMATAGPSTNGSIAGLFPNRLTAVAASLNEDRTASLHRFCRAERLTFGSLVAATWAAILAAYSGTPDVCFGTTLSGRESPVPGIDRIVGTLINALPVRALVPRDSAAVAFLHEMQDRLIILRQYEHTPPDRIQEWSSVPGHRRVFDSLVVFENFPARSASAGDALQIDDLHGGVTTTAALTLVAAPGPRFEIRLLFDASRIPDASARALLDRILAMLDAFERDPRSPLSSVIENVMGEPRSGEGDLHSRTIDLKARPIGNVTNRTQGSRDHAVESVDPLELQLIQIFESVLRVQPVGLKDDFFALGGHSLIAARLFDRIEQLLGRRLPLATLFEASSVEALATRLRSDGWTPPWSCLVTMQPEGTRPPIFCVHSYEGHILHYRDLARRLAPDQPVYGLQSLGLNGACPPLLRVEDMAAHYLSEIQTVQPEGPYNLAAMCFGIAVTFEMAQQLIAQGHRVKHLFILDSGFLHFLPPQPKLDRPFVHGALWRIAAHSRGVRFRAARILHQLRESDHEKNIRRVRESNERAWWRYQPKPYAGTITLLRSEQYGSGQDWHIDTWSRLVHRIETYVVPGDHTSMLHEPLVEHLGTQIRSCLRSHVPV